MSSLFDTAGAESDTDVEPVVDQEPRVFWNVPPSSFLREWREAQDAQPPKPAPTSPGRQAPQVGSSAWRRTDSTSSTSTSTSVATSSTDQSTSTANLSSDGICQRPRRTKSLRPVKAMRGWRRHASSSATFPTDDRSARSSENSPWSDRPPSAVMMGPPAKCTGSHSRSPLKRAGETLSRSGSAGSGNGWHHPERGKAFSRQNSASSKMQRLLADLSIKVQELERDDAEDDDEDLDETADAAEERDGPDSDVDDTITSDSVELRARLNCRAQSHDNGQSQESQGSTNSGTTLTPGVGGTATPTSPGRRNVNGQKGKSPAPRQTRPTATGSKPPKQGALPSSSTLWERSVTFPPTGSPASSSARGGTTSVRQSITTASDDRYDEFGFDDGDGFDLLDWDEALLPEDSGWAEVAGSAEASKKGTSNGHARVHRPEYVTMGDANRPEALAGLHIDRGLRISATKREKLELLPPIDASGLPESNGVVRANYQARSSALGKRQHPATPKHKVAPPRTHVPDPHEDDISYWQGCTLDSPSIDESAAFADPLSQSQTREPAQGSPSPVCKRPRGDGVGPTTDIDPGDPSIEPPSQHSAVRPSTFYSSTRSKSASASSSGPGGADRERLTAASRNPSRLGHSIARRSNSSQAQSSNLAPDSKPQSHQANTSIIPSRGRGRPAGLSRPGSTPRANASTHARMSAYPTSAAASTAQSGLVPATSFTFKPPMKSGSGLAAPSAYTRGVTAARGAAGEEGEEPGDGDESSVEYDYDYDEIDKVMTAQGY